MFEELPRLFKRFWGMLTVMTLIIAGVGIMTASSFIPMEYVVTDPLVMVPLLTVAIPHLLFCFVLNPYLTRFRF